MTKSSRARRRRIQQGARFASLAVAVFAMPTAAFAAADSQSEKIGPWEIEATFKGDKFDRCSINRSLQDDIVATFIRTSDGLSLELGSPNWKLDRGKDYPVKMTLGPLSFDTEVAAEPNSVSMDVKDKKFETGLRSANALNVVAAGATIRVPLDQSTAALERLEQCVKRTARRSKPTLLWFRHVGRNGRRVGGQRPRLPRDQGEQGRAR